MRLFCQIFKQHGKWGIASQAGWWSFVCQIIVPLVNMGSNNMLFSSWKKRAALCSATAPLEWLIKTLGLCELLFIHAGCHLGPPSFQKKRAIFMRLLFTRHSKTVAASGLSASAKLCMLLTQGRKSIIQEWKPNTISSSVPLPLQGDDEFIINTSAGEMEKLSTVQVLMKKTFPIPGASLMTWTDIITFWWAHTIANCNSWKNTHVLLPPQAPQARGSILKKESPFPSQSVPLLRRYMNDQW